MNERMVEITIGKPPVAVFLKKERAFAACALFLIMLKLLHRERHPGESILVLRLDTAADAVAEERQVLGSIPRNRLVRETAPRAQNASPSTSRTWADPGRNASMS